MQRKYYSWTNEELDLLRRLYPTADKRFLIASLRNRKWLAIQKKAQKLNVTREIEKYNDLSPLLTETPEAYYWLGFLMADGSFTHNRISLAISGDDIEHLQRFRSFVKSTNKLSKIGKNYHRLKCTDGSVVRALRDKFKIHNNKTHNPCDISGIANRNLMFALFIGFFDGDGCLYHRKPWNSFTMSMVGHPAWLNNFQMFGDFLQKYLGQTLKSRHCWTAQTSTSVPQNPEKKTYTLAYFSITNRSLIRKIALQATALELPYLQRKLGQVAN